MTTGDTIVAISTAAGSAARMILRVSGARAWEMTAALCPGLRPGPAVATPARVHLRRGMIVPATLYPFHGPRSYSGEDLVEFHIPGNPLLARLLLDELTARGARPAEAGEFTARAYLHGRMDLTEAEGIAATIAAHSDQELRAARQLMAGELARRLRPAMDVIADTLALIEVGIDFTEEDVTFLPADEAGQRIARADELLREIVGHSARFERLAHEPRAVLVGRPNAGKSTLLNALARRERSIVSPVAGTTRDALSAEVALPRGLIRLVDVAGIVEEAAADADADATAAAPIERQMRRHALRELESADLVLLVHDGSSAAADAPMALPRAADITVVTKHDLAPASAVAGVHVSALTGHNLQALRDRLDELAFGSSSAGASAAVALNARHVRAIDAARAALSRAAAIDPGSTELLALELREALDELGRVLGRVSPDDLLGRIFSTFCIGK